MIYGPPTLRLGTVNRPSPRVGNICLKPASAHSITTVAADNGTPLGSLTIPLSVAVVTWENNDWEQHNKRNSVNA